MLWLCSAIMHSVDAQRTDARSIAVEDRLHAQLWREVSLHLELEESIRRVIAILNRYAPVDLLLLRRIDWSAGRLVTVAAATLPGVETPTIPAARTDYSDLESVALRRFIGSGIPIHISPENISPIANIVVPSGIGNSVIAGPLPAEDAPEGVVIIAGRRGILGAEHIPIIQAALEPLQVALSNDKRLHDLARMREALEADREALLTRLDRQDISEVIIGERGGLRDVMQRVEQVSPTDVPVLILGETGSGKEVIARAIHSRSGRSKGPIVRVNCGAISPELIDSELFGHERGSFTGAVGTRKGWFERADGGTLFLDEIGELSHAAQVRLLRVLQEGTLERVGGHSPISVDVRVVAATHRDLASMVKENRFREDLWYRVSVFPIHLPALRERLDDLRELATHFAAKAGVRLGGKPLELPANGELLLRNYRWPGNVRELASVIERAAILGDGKRLDLTTALGSTTKPEGNSRNVIAVGNSARSYSPSDIERSDSIGTLDDAMAEHIKSALAATRGQVEGDSGAARILGINPHTLRARMRKLRVDWTQFRR